MLYPSEGVEPMEEFRIDSCETDGVLELWADGLLE